MPQTSRAKPLVLVVTGPTASGKSETALLLAEKIGAEIVSADSMQLYRGMDIGTAKVSPSDQARVPHHLIDSLDPGEPFSVAAYQQLAEQTIATIWKRGVQPILCGGTGQYISALTEGLRFAPVPADPNVRAGLLKEADQEGLPRLWQSLQQIDPEAAARISPNDRKRIIRALEIYHLTGQPLSWHDARSRDHAPVFDYRIYCLTHDRAVLYNRIDERVLQMISQGLPAEVQHLLERDLPAGSTSLQAIGYKEWLAYLQGQMTREGAIANIQQASRRYAKRQLTWFRKMQAVIWIENADPLTACQQILADLEKHPLHDHIKK